MPSLSPGEWIVVLLLIVVGIFCMWFLRWMNAWFFRINEVIDELKAIRTELQRANGVRSPAP
jgi:predicted permease